MNLKHAYLSMRRPGPMAGNHVDAGRVRALRWAQMPASAALGAAKERMSERAGLLKRIERAAREGDADNVILWSGILRDLEDSPYAPASGWNAHKG